MYARKRACMATRLNNPLYSYFPLFGVPILSLFPSFPFVFLIPQGPMLRKATSGSHSVLRLPVASVRINPIPQDLRRNCFFFFNSLSLLSLFVCLRFFGVEKDSSSLNIHLHKTKTRCSVANQLFLLL